MFNWTACGIFVWLATAIVLLWQHDCLAQISTAQQSSGVRSDQSDHAKSDRVRAEFRKFCRDQLADLPFLNSAMSYQYLRFVWWTNAQELDGAPQLIFVVDQPARRSSSGKPSKQRALGSNHFVAWKSESEIATVRDHAAFFAGTSYPNVKYDNIFIHNPQYSAELKLKDTSASLRSITRGNSLTVAPFGDFLGLYAYRTFWDVIDDEEVVFVRWENTVFNGMDAWQIVYRDKNRHSKVVRITATFAASDGRCLELYYVDETNPDEVLCRSTFEYSDVAGKLAPKKLIEEDFEEGFQIITCYREVKYLKRVDRNQFYLSHYGIPEPDWYVRPKPYWLYASIAGLVLLAVGTVLIRFGRRKLK